MSESYEHKQREKKKETVELLEQLKNMNEKSK